MPPAAQPSVPQSESANPLLTGLSIEITAKDQHHLDGLTRGFPLGTPVSVTFLPGESFEDRIAAAQRVRAAGFTPVPHISARRLQSSAELENFVAGLADAAAVTRVFVVGGDLPQPAGPYQDALAVIQSGVLAFHGIEEVGIAGYPEGHPDIAAPVLAAALADKLAAIRAAGQRGFIATQFSFDAAPVLDWLAALRSAGVTETVRIGVPGPASVKTLLRFAARCGVGVSTKVMTRYGLSMTQLLGNAGPDKLIAALAEGLVPEIHGDARLHFYPFGGLEKTADWVARNL